MKTLRELTKAATAMQRGKRSPEDMSAILDAFVPATSFDKRFIDALRDAVAWRAKAKSEGRPYIVL